MYTSFYIAENRLDELKSFIRTFTPTVRFKHNPLKEGNQWFIALTMEVEDNNKLNELFNKWHNEDNLPKKVIIIGNIGLGSICTNQKTKKYEISKN